MNSSNHEHKHFPEVLAFTLNNRIRRFLQPPDRIISKLDVKPSDTVVDFGCGPGFFTVPLSRVAAKTIAIDISPRMLEKAASHAKKSGATAEFLLSNGTEITLEDRSADLIFLHHVFHEIDDRPRVLCEFLRIMKRSGRLAIVERTSGRGLLGGRFGPPIIDPIGVIREIENAGFVFVQTITHGSDSVVVAQKP